jgi:hypothetical protein
MPSLRLTLMVANAWGLQLIVVAIVHGNLVLNPSRRYPSHWPHARPLPLTRIQGRHHAYIGRRQ